MEAVMYGGGNIGRGFIGLLFSQSGYHVTFIDVAQPVVANLNERHEYPVRILSNDWHEDIRVENVSAIDGSNSGAVAQAIARADIMATAVGVNVLPRIVANLAAGIKLRLAATDKPLNILICENLLDADQYLAGLIRELLTPEEQALFGQRIGLVEASIGRMVPVQTEEMKDGNPLRVCVERYGWLPVDKDAFKGGIPDIKGLVPYSPFGFFIKRKLFVHNMGHAVCAYLGAYTGHQYVWQAIDDPEILLLVKNAMLESAGALAAEYNVNMQSLMPHIEDLLLRFTNRALGDTCARVGADLTRKLGPDDRLVGAARLCEKQKLPCTHISVGIAGAVFRYLLDSGQPQTIENARKVLAEICQIVPEDPLATQAEEWYALFAAGTRPQQLRVTAQSKSVRQQI